MRISILILSIILAFSGMGQTMDKENKLLCKYLAALSNTMHGESKKEDVANLMSLYAINAVYEHPKAGFRIIDRVNIEKGINAFLGGYGGNKDSVKIEILRSILKEDVSIIEFKIQFLDKDNNKIKRTQLKVIEHTDLEITRIIDYW
jgi:hypothetical protein